MPDYRVSGEKNGDIWHENSRKPVFEFRLLGEKGKGVFCKSLPLYISQTQMKPSTSWYLQPTTKRSSETQIGFQTTFLFQGDRLIC
ncbi:hypothetical protein HMPREF2557_02165 [Neisseria sp. HMSC064F03]|nr:hypothetical protein HMPREF2675_05055 [Neisseria sp. HMSC061H08]OHQ11703.1 hypothetical protein HMPREF2557_02165 [Neisseria sp. HMSC064F03]